MNSRFLLGRSLHMGNMRIVRSVAASFNFSLSELTSRGSELNHCAAF